MRLVDLTGQIFGRLTVIRRGPRAGAGKSARWICRCACGTEKEYGSDDLRGGTTRSCGCLRRELLRQSMKLKRKTAKFIGANIKHGLSGTPEYCAYRTAKNRCTRPTDPQYADYGARGIRFLFDGPERLVGEIGLRPSPRYSLDRINVNGNYEPGNVRWATAQEQWLNRRPCKGCPHIKPEAPEIDLCALTDFYGSEATVYGC